MPEQDSELDDVKYITARRAYQFGADDLRLSALCTKPVEERLQALFQFRSAVMGSPIPMFGDVPPAYPPGYVYDLGFWVSPRNTLVPIRFMHFEPRRIVIDLAGKSEDITPIYDLMRKALSDLALPDGTALIGEPEAVDDYTEITAHCNFLLTDILGAKPFDLMAGAGKTKRKAQIVAVPNVTLQWLPADEEYAGASTSSSPYSFNFGVRAGTKPGENICFSGAPVESEAHYTYLRKLAHALSAIH